MHCDWEDCDYWSSFDYHYGLKLVANQWQSPDGSVPKHNHWVSLDGASFPLSEGGMGNCGRLYTLKNDENDLKSYHSDCNDPLHAICEVPIQSWYKFWC